MTALITLLTSTSLIGPFNIYSNVDGFISAFAIGVSRDKLIAGYGTNSMPTGTTIVRLMSSGACTNYIDITFVAPPPPPFRLSYDIKDRLYACALFGPTTPANYCLVGGTTLETADHVVDAPLCTVRSLQGFYSNGIITRYQDTTGPLFTAVPCADTTTTTSTTVFCNVTSPIKLSYDLSNPATACANFDINTAPTYYTLNNGSFATTDQLNETPLCTRRASIGYYSNGIISRYFNSSGAFNVPIACV